VASLATRIFVSSLAAAWLAGLVAAPAIAGTVSDQFSAGAAPTNQEAPRTGFFSDRLIGTNELSENVGITYDATVTHDSGAPAVGSGFPDRGGTVFRFGLGTDWQFSSHWALLARAVGSLPSVSLTAATVPFDTAAGIATTVDAEVRVHSWSAGGEVGVEYDSLELLKTQLIATLTVGATDYDSTQRLRRLRQVNGTVVTLAQLQQRCRQKGCSAQIRSLLRRDQFAVVQSYGAADLTAAGHWLEGGLAGTVYLYSQDPSDLGFFGVAAFGRGAVMGDATTFAPLRWSARAHTLLRAGRWRVGLTGELDGYVAGLGTSVVETLKPSFDLTRSLRLWLVAALQHDWDEQGYAGTTAWGAIGLRWSY
jgi:hypothetical protein